MMGLLSSGIGRGIAVYIVFSYRLGLVRWCSWLNRELLLPDRIKICIFVTDFNCFFFSILINHLLTFLSQKRRKSPINNELSRIKSLLIYSMQLLLGDLWKNVSILLRRLKGSLFSCAMESSGMLGVQFVNYRVLSPNEVVFYSLKFVYFQVFYCILLLHPYYCFLWYVSKLSECCERWLKFILILVLLFKNTFWWTLQQLGFYSECRWVVSTSGLMISWACECWLWWVNSFK